MLAAQKIRALDLIRPERIDLVVKWMLFDTLSDPRYSDETRAEVRNLYIRHIFQRTGGNEPPFENHFTNKRSTDDYISAAELLFESMQRHGFLEKSPIPLGVDGLPLNGAHRIAAAAQLNTSVFACVQQAPGISWDFSWFRRHNFQQECLLRLLSGWLRLKSSSSAVFFLWPTARPFWNEMKTAIAQELKEVGSVDIDFSEGEREAFYSLVYDIYSNDIVDFATGFDHIDKKISHFESVAPGMRVIVSEIRPKRNNITLLKRELRERFHPILRMDDFITLHSAEGVNEIDLVRKILEPANIAAVRLRNERKPSDKFLKHFNTYHSTIVGNEIPLNNCCIVGGAVLEILGIRRADDIDFTLTKDFRSSKFDSGITAFGNGIDLVTEGYHRRNGAVWFSDDQLVHDNRLHFCFRGATVASLDIVRDRKDYSRRSKDLVDIKLIGLRLQKVSWNRKSFINFVAVLRQFRVILRGRIAFLLRRLHRGFK